jgi:hypothetical protein
MKQIETEQRRGKEKRTVAEQEGHFVDDSREHLLIVARRRVRALNAVCSRKQQGGEGIKNDNEKSS